MHNSECIFCPKLCQRERGCIRAGSLALPPLRRSPSSFPRKPESSGGGGVTLRLQTKPTRAYSPNVLDRAFVRMRTYLLRSRHASPQRKSQCVFPWKMVGDCVWRIFMTMPKRPRVAAIGLKDDQIASIESLCGELREAYSLGEYLQRYSLTETDILVSDCLLGEEVDSNVNLMAIGPNQFRWLDFSGTGDRRDRRNVDTNAENTEREFTVPPTCPDLYRGLANELSRHLSQASEPPDVISTEREGQTALIETTSGRPVALRIELPPRSRGAGGGERRPIALLLPESSYLVAWFSAFLNDIHKSDPARVPQAPPRLSQPSDWYTLQESVLADRIAEIDSEIERLSGERHQLQAELAAEGERAEQGPRRALWADGDELTAAVSNLLTDLRFEVRNMDAKLKQGEPKREDLRLTLQGTPGWEAIVEVKGYTNGTRTSDSRQIREYRDRYIEEEGRPPNLTVWLANPFRSRDPSSRPAPDQNVKEFAEAISSVHVLASDLYRQWALVVGGSLDADTVIESLVNSKPGLWTPPVPTSGS